MNYIKALLLAITLFWSLSGNSQISFSQNIGVGMMLCDIGGGPTLEYNPRLNFVELGDFASLSISAPIAAGIYVSGGSGVYGFSLPIMGQLNIGASSTPDNSSLLGAFIGGGYGYGLFDTYWSRTTTLGPIFHVGFIYSDYDTYGIRFSVNKSIEATELIDFGASIFTVGLFYGIEY